MSVETMRLIQLLFFAGAGVVTIAFMMRARARGQKTMRALKGYEGFTGAEMSFSGHVTSRSSHGSYRCTVSPAAWASGQHSHRDYWGVVVEGVRVGQRTPFTIARENVLTRVGTKLGLADIQVGDEAFDEAYRINGRNEEGIRALLVVPEVRAAIAEVFAVAGQEELALQSDASLTFRTERKGADAAEMDAAARLGAKLARLLDAHQNAGRLDAPAEKRVEVPALHSVSGGSGAPVGLGSGSE